MRTDQIPRTNFGHLEIHEPQLVRLGMLAERYFADRRGPVRRQRCEPFDGG
jgi:hypothetical protein